MTKPVFEPTTDRDISGQGYVTSQLERRPSVAAEGAGGIPHLWMAYDNITIESTNTEQVFDDVNTTIDGSDLASLDATADGGFYWLDFKEEGIYAFYFGVTWTTAFGGEIQVSFQPFDQDAFLGLDGGTSPSVFLDSTESDTSGHSIRYSSVQGRVVVADIPGGSMAALGCFVANQSGSDRTIDTTIAIAHQVMAF